MDTKMLDKLDMMIVLGAKDCGEDDVNLLDNLDTTGVALDKSFHRRRVRIVEKHKHYPTILMLKKGILFVMVLLMTVMSLGFTTIMAISPMRRAVFNVVIEWYENYITIRYEQEGSTADSVTDGDENEVTNNPVLTSPAVIEEVRKPTYNAENVIEDIVMENKSFVCIDYYKGDVLAYTYNQMSLSSKDMYLDNEGVFIQTIDINGNEGTVIQHTGFSGITIVWSDGEYIYQMITQTTPLEELIAVCRSVE